MTELRALPQTRQGHGLAAFSHFRRDARTGLQLNMSCKLAEPACSASSGDRSRG